MGWPAIQPFQASLVPTAGCNQLNVHCCSPPQFQQCLKVADRPGAAVSLSDENTLGYRSQLGGRSFNTFLSHGR
ncbi:hypothetical protein [Synechococcus sp. CCY 9618]|uniref:hypothetical protein n=1 Tax=Synechococcus sp. CCY 9618 TaxID=2815602 RepID=UPI001C2361F5|nr:hypothetical protein [Synechococcus sp. CCY 9618]